MCNFKYNHLINTEGATQLLATESKAPIFGLRHRLDFSDPENRSLLQRRCENLEYLA
jgi:hypothetical protein